MGTTAHVIVVGGDGKEASLLDHAETRVAELEDKWSRFRAASELSRLNVLHDRPVIVSPETFDVISKAVDAWFLTAGRYDPTVLRALVAAGYDRPFDQIPAFARTHPAVKAEGCAEIRLHPPNAVTLPDGVTLDLGGIGKGYAADLVAAELLDHGADGACVSIGGDMRCMGAAPWPEGWLIDIEHPFDDTRTALTVALAEGAVVTTTRLKRRWGTAADRQHHIIDPFTGRPADNGVASVTVVSAEAWWAEVLAKAAFLAGPIDGVRLLARHGVSGVVFDDDGGVHPVEKLAAFTA